MTGKVAFVSGGAGGLGAAICRRFVRDGAAVAIADIDRARSEALAGEIVESGGRALPVALDSASSASVQQAVDETVDHFGRCDFLIHGAGNTAIAPLLELPEADWRSVLDTHLTGGFLLCQAIGRQLVRQGEGGRVVLISSVGAMVPVPDRGAYSPAKAGLIALAQMLSIEWAPYDINVNAICPGVTQTPMVQEIYRRRPELRDQRIRRFPKKREAVPEEIADLAVFLCGDGSTYISGTAITIDGGFINAGFMPEDE